MRNQILLLLASLLWLPCLAQSRKFGKYAYLHVSDIAYIRQHPKKFEKIVRFAEKNINYQPNPTQEFSPDPHYNEKGINHTENDGKNFQSDSRAAFQLALAYVVTGKTEYAKTAQKILDAWALQLQKIGSEQGKAVINFNAAYMIAAASITKDANSWDSAQFDQFLRTKILSVSARENPNNHGMWAILMEATSAQYFNDKKMMESAYARFNEIIHGAIDEDGVLIREVQRSGTNNWTGGADKGIKGLAYTHYALQPVALSAKIFHDSGYSIWTSESGSRLKKAYKKAAYWSNHPEKFPYYQGSYKDLQGVDNGAYFVVFQRYIPTQEGKNAIKNRKLGGNGFAMLEIFGNR